MDDRFLWSVVSTWVMIGLLALPLVGEIIEEWLR